MGLNLIIFMVCIAFCKHVYAQSQQTPKIISVKTTVGEIKGCEEEITFLGNTAKISKFFGIPFAQPPIGNLRFKKPVPVENFRIPFDALKPGNACLQPKFLQDPDRMITYSEDCLFLNIFAPAIDDYSKYNKQFAVMVYIHGGDFGSGSADNYQADHIVVQGKVIVVTFNYRLSLWGFLSTGDKAAPGNYGLWDQQLAIKWVHDNIQWFGGDPDRITLFGNAAGSVSAIYQGIYPGNSGLFKRILGQSGAPGAWFGSNENAAQSAQTLASLLGCNTGDTNKLVDCLRQIPVDKLVNLISDSGLFTSIPSLFLPRNDGEFITYDPKQIFNNEYRDSLSMQQRNILSSLDVLTGLNTGDGGIAVSPLFGIFDSENFFPLRQYFETSLVPRFVALGFGGVDDIVRDTIIAEYTNWTSPDELSNVREEYINLHSDFAFTRPLYNAVNLFTALSTTNNTYMYVFDVLPHFHSTIDASWMHKPSHGEEIPFVFGYKSSNRVAVSRTWLYAPWEIHFSRDIITLWTNFAKSGNPIKPDDIGVDWPSYTQKNQHYLHITRCLTSSSVKQRWNLRRANFWTNLLPEIIKSTNCRKRRNRRNAVTFR